MPELKVWIGGTPEKAQVVKVTLPADIESGQVLKGTIGTKTVEYTFPDGPLRPDVVTAFAALWEEKATTVPEFTAVDITDNGDGSFTLSAAAAGRPFIATFLIGSGTNEIQTVALLGDPTGGSFTLDFDGEETVAIAHNASAATMQTALEGLSNIDPGDVAVSGPDGGPWIIQYQGNLADTDVALLIADDTLLEGTNEEQVITLASASGGTFAASFGGQTTGPIAHNASAGTLQTSLEGLSTIGAGNVSVTGSGPWTVEFVGDLRGTDVTLITVDGSNLTGVLDASIVETTPGGGGSSEVWQLMMYNQSGNKGITRIGGDAGVTGGTFTIKIESPGPTVYMQTGPIAFDATAAEVVEAFEASVYGKADGGYYPLCFVASHEIAGSKLSDGDDYIIHIHPFVGNDNQDYELSVDSTSLTGGGYALSGVGGPGSMNGASPTNFTSFYLDIDGEETDDIPFDASAAAIKTALEGLPNVGAGNVNVTTSGANDSYDPFVLKIEFIGELANQNTGFTVDVKTHNAVAVTEEEYELVAGDAGTAEVQTLSIAGAPGSGTFGLRYDDVDTVLLDYNSTAGEVQTALEAIVGVGNVTCSGGALPGSPVVITFAGALGGADLDPIDVIFGISVETVTGGGLPSVEIKTTQTKIDTVTVTENEGPEDWGTATNWDTMEVPETGDTAVIPDGDSIRYGLDQSDVTLALLRFEARDTQMGLPRRDSDDNLEYLDQFLKIKATKIVIDTNSQLVKIDTLDSSPEIEVINSGTGQDDEHAVQIVSQNVANTATLLVVNGDVSVATGPKEAAYLKTIVQRGGQVWTGSDVGLEDIERTGGIFRADRTTINGTVTL